MIGKVKDFFGIEGVRLELFVPDDFKLSSGKIKGTLKLSSLRSQKVKALSIELRERYTRGRGESKLIDTYVLGYLRESTDLKVAANEEVFLPFELCFAERHTAMDNFSSRSPLLKPLGKLARFSAGATSTYTLVGTALVKGVKLSPEVKLVLN